MQKSWKQNENLSVSTRQQNTDDGEEKSEVEDKSKGYPV